MKVAILCSDVIKPDEIVEIGIIDGDSMMKRRTVLPEQSIQINKIKTKIYLMLDYYRLLRLLLLEDKGSHGRLRVDEGR